MSELFIEPPSMPSQEPDTEKPPIELDGPYDAERAMTKIRKANLEAESLRRQIAELKPQADRLRQMEEASKSEAQRLADAKDAAERRADEATANAVRYKAAAMYGIPADHFDLLGSGSEEEITARAVKLQSLLAAQTPAVPPTTPPPPGRPVETMRPGATPSTTETEDDVLLKSLGFAVS